MPILSPGVAAGTFNCLLLLLSCACCCLLAAAKMCCSPLDAKKWCKTSTGYTQLGHQDSRLAPNWVLVLVNALEITVQQSPLAMQMFIHGRYD